MKRDAWTSNFNAMIYALDFPEAEVDSPSQPEQPPGAVVHIPDPNLRAAIAEALGKSPNAPITVEEMGKLGRLDAQNRGIQDLIGIQFATNLKRLNLRNNQIFDLSPLAVLVLLHELNLSSNAQIEQFSDLSPLSGLINLKRLDFDSKNVFDLSPLSQLTKLEYFTLYRYQCVRFLTTSRTHQLRVFRIQPHTRHIRYIPACRISQLEIHRQLGGTVSPIYRHLQD